jgi:hypothetical protein
MGTPEVGRMPVIKRVPISCESVHWHLPMNTSRQVVKDQYHRGGLQHDGRWKNKL